MLLSGYRDACDKSRDKNANSIKIVFLSIACAFKSFYFVTIVQIRGGTQKKIF